MQAEPNLSILSNNLQYDLNMPLYYQIMSMIKRGVFNGTLQPGDLLPTEEQFCKRFDISRTTVRQAFAALVKEGVVVRVQGKGTFVSGQQKLDRKMDSIYSFTHEMESIGLRASSRVIGCELIAPDEDLMQLFARNASDPVYRIVRVRLATGQPLLLETAYLPAAVIGDLDGKIRDNTSLYNLLNERGVEPFRAEETYESILLSGEESRLLECAENTPGFRIERIAWLQNGQIYEFTQSVMRGDRSKIVVRLQQNSCMVNRSVE